MAKHVVHRMTRNAAIYMQRVQDLAMPQVQTEQNTGALQGWSSLGTHKFY
jgi:hypothetical protein